MNDILNVFSGLHANVIMIIVSVQFTCNCVDM